MEEVLIRWKESLNNKEWNLHLCLDTDAVKFIAAIQTAEIIEVFRIKLSIRLN